MVKIAIGGFDMSSKDKQKKSDQKCCCKDYMDNEKNGCDYADAYNWMQYPCHNMPMYPMSMMPMYMMNPMYMCQYYYMMRPMMYHHMMQMGMPCMCGPQQPTKTDCSCKTWYQTKPGDCMCKIAKMYNVPLRRLMACNPHISKPEQIRPGQRVCIPMQAAPGAKEAMPQPQPMPMPMPDMNMNIDMDIDLDLEMEMQMQMQPNRSSWRQPKTAPYPYPYPMRQQMTPPEPNSEEPEPMDEDCMWYTVKPGDTMYKIAQENNVSLDELIGANPKIKEPYVLYPAMKICIPQDNGMPMLPNNCKSIYTVQSGDTMYRIAQRNKVSLEELLEANPQIKDPSILYVGQKICIPKNNQLPECEEYYSVKPGDTMYDIAQRYDLSLDALVAANPQIANPAILYPGQKICIPEEE